VVSGETMKNAFERASAVPFEIPGRRLSDTEDIIANTDADFIDRLWLLGSRTVLMLDADLDYPRFDLGFAKLCTTARSSAGSTGLGR